MRTISLFLLMFALVFNTFVLNAFAATCVSKSRNETTHKVMASNEMPCENHEEQSRDTKHCDGVCLCFDAALNNIPLIEVDTSQHKLSLYEPALSVREYHFVSTTTAPPYRPPKSDA